MAKYTDWMTEDGLLQVEGWARDGLIDEQIAENMGIAVSTLNEWKKRFPEFRKSLKKKKEIPDRHVENALYNNAAGYEYTEEVPIKVKEVYYDEEGRRCSREKVVVKEVTKFKPPETTAQIFWLKNRKPETWRDKQDISHSGGINVRKQYEDMSDEELESLVARYEKINQS